MFIYLFNSCSYFLRILSYHIHIGHNDIFQLTMGPLERCIITSRGAYVYIFMYTARHTGLNDTLVVSAWGRSWIQHRTHFTSGDFKTYMKKRITIKKSNVCYAAFIDASFLSLPAFVLIPIQYLYPCSVSKGYLDNIIYYIKKICSLASSSGIILPYSFQNHYFKKCEVLFLSLVTFSPIKLVSSTFFSGSSEPSWLIPTAAFTDSLWRTFFQKSYKIYCGRRSTFWRTRDLMV